MENYAKVCPQTEINHPMSKLAMILQINSYFRCAVVTARYRTADFGDGRHYEGSRGFEEKPLGETVYGFL